MKRVKITATSGDYPTICGIHEFTTMDEAIDFAYYGAKGLNDDVHELVIEFDVDQRWNPGIDVIIEIYDGYRE